MKRLALVTLAMVAMAVASYAASEPGFVSLKSITKLLTGTHAVGIVRTVSGPVSIKADAACTAYLNLSTAARAKAGTGWPLSANTEYKFNVPQTSTLTFLCATSATADKYVYIVR